MKKNNTSSIKRTLLLVLLLCSSIALALSAVGYIASDWYQSRNDTMAEIKVEGEIVGRNSAAALLFNDEAVANNILSSLAAQQDIVAAALFTNAGELFVQFQNGSISPKVHLPKDEEGEFGEFLYVKLPVLQAYEQVGTIVIFAVHNKWKQVVAKSLVTSAILFVVSLLVVFIISNRLQRIVTDPIIDLASTVRRIAVSQNYNLRADKKSTDEIGELVDDFNNMLDEIQFRDRQLQGATEKLEDIVAERTAELVDLTKQLEHQAFFDELTGLSNRTTLNEKLDTHIEELTKTGGSLAVFFMDLDRFKVINDTLGHIIGDKLLQSVGKRFSYCADDCDTLARLGGDEFAVLMVNPEDQKQIITTANRLIHAMDQTVEVDGYSLHVTTSIGISVFPQDGTTAEEILKNADTAMYRSKDLGRNQFAFYSATMNAKALRRLTLENKLREALNNEQFTVHYQPKFSVKYQAIMGVEALVRWHDAEEGEIPPAEFLPVADECGLTAMIDEWVMHKACAQLMKWHSDGINLVSLSVNLSSGQFIRSNLPAILKNTLDVTGFPASMLEIEVVEDIFGPDTGDVQSILTDIQKMGVSVSIDDFGKAYSSLARLKELPIDTLKIDKSFVDKIGLDHDDEILLASIIAMGHGMRLDVVIEGVESKQQLDFVSEHGADYVQGYYFCRPLSPKFMKTMLGSRQKSTQIA